MKPSCGVPVTFIASLNVTRNRMVSFLPYVSVTPSPSVSKVGSETISTDLTVGGSVDLYHECQARLVRRVAASRVRAVGVLGRVGDRCRTRLVVGVPVIVREIGR